MSPNNTVNGFDADTFVFLNGSPLFLIREHRIIRVCVFLNRVIQSAIRNSIAALILKLNPFSDSLSPLLHPIASVNAFLLEW